VAQRVLHHYSTRSGLSLGVVAMSDRRCGRSKTRWNRRGASGRPRSILRGRSPERLLREEPGDGPGDERDVIILSVGYGPDQHGKLTMLFGPLNRENGWRRLNVAVTRARHRVEVIASMTGGTSPRATIAAATSSTLSGLRRAWPRCPEPHTDRRRRGAGEPVRRVGAERAPRLGLRRATQVGVGAYRIDMAVRHPAAPGRYVIGIECDGAMYHSSRAARDRDRLRADILHGLGWELHRSGEQTGTATGRSPNRRSERPSKRRSRGRCAPLRRHPASSPRSPCVSSTKMWPPRPTGTGRLSTGVPGRDRPRHLLRCMSRARDRSSRAFCARSSRWRRPSMSTFSTEEWLRAGMSCASAPGFPHQSRCGPPLCGPAPIPG